MKLNWVIATHVGRVRVYNEDAAAVVGQSGGAHILGVSSGLKQGSLNTPAQVAVADGLGGQMLERSRPGWL